MSTIPTASSPCYERFERNAEATSSSGQVFSYYIADIKSFEALPSFLKDLHLIDNVRVIGAEKGYPRRSVMIFLTCTYKIINMVSCNKKSQLQ